MDTSNFAIGDSVWITEIITQRCDCGVTTQLHGRECIVASDPKQRPVRLDFVEVHNCPCNERPHFDDHGIDCLRYASTTKPTPRKFEFNDKVLCTSGDMKGHEGRVAVDWGTGVLTVTFSKILHENTLVKVTP